MSQAELLYLLPYLIPVAIVTGIFVYILERRQLKGIRAYSWFMAGQVLLMIAFILEMITPSLEIKILWDKLQWIFDSLIIFPAFVIFTIQFTEYELKKKWLAWFYWLMPAIFIFLLLTDNVHHLIYPNPSLSSAQPFTELKYDFTIAIYLYALLFVYGSSLFGVGLLIWKGLHTQTFYRKQYFVIAAGFIIPLVISFFTLAGIQITGQRDVSPFSFALGNLVVLWGIFRYGTFDFMPIMRERIVENLNDPVVVLDANLRVMDINAAALINFKANYREAIGTQAEIFFKDYPDLSNLFIKSGEKHKEVSIKGDFDTLFYDVHISTIHDRTQKLLGYIMVAHDVTKFKTLELSYRLLSAELEERVKHQTRELATSEEKFSKAFQASPDAIVLAEAESGRLVEVNEGFEKIFGYSRAEVLNNSILSLNIFSSPDDRTRMLDELKKNGSFHKKEYRGSDKFGRDRIVQVSAELIEIDGVPHIVSINHDITEIKKAEQDLKEAYDTTLEGWAKALELRDKETEGHSRRVTEATLKIAEAVGFTGEELVHIRRGALLHDIGKMAISDDILRKNGPLTAEERKIIETHPVVAHDLLVNIPHLKKSMDIPYYHHEKWDGSGYPCSLSGSEIPLTARIFAVVDVWDALSSDRPYRNAWDKEKVKHYLQEEAGKHFDPEIVYIFVQLLDQGRL